MQHRNQGEPKRTLMMEEGPRAGLMGHAAFEQCTQRCVPVCMGGEEGKDHSCISFSQPSIKVS